MAARLGVIPCFSHPWCAETGSGRRVSCLRSGRPGRRSHPRGSAASGLGDRAARATWRKTARAAGGQTRGTAVSGDSALLTRAWLTWDMPTRALLTQALLLARPALTRTLLPGHRTVRAQTTRPRP